MAKSSSSSGHSTEELLRTAKDIIARGRSSCSDSGIRQPPAVVLVPDDVSTDMSDRSRPSSDRTGSPRQLPAVPVATATIIRDKSPARDKSPGRALPSRPTLSSDAPPTGRMVGRRQSVSVERVSSVAIATRCESHSSTSSADSSDSNKAEPVFYVAKVTDRVDSTPRVRVQVVAGNKYVQRSLLDECCNLINKAKHGSYEAVSSTSSAKHTRSTIVVDGASVTSHGSLDSRILYDERFVEWLRRFESML